MSEKFLLVSMDDEKSKKLGEIISNPSARKIINLLAEKELSISEIAREFSMPINSVQYNVEKLLEAGVIEESKSFWSIKGKKMPVYKAANKLIVISPKKTSNFYSKIKSVIPVVLVSGVFTGMFMWFNKIPQSDFMRDANVSIERGIAALSQAGDGLTNTAVSIAVNNSGTPGYVWFLIAIWLAILGFAIYSFVKK